MKSKINLEQTKNIFKRMFIEEFEDPNEAFMDFLLDLIPKTTLKRIITKGNKCYYSAMRKYLYEE